MARFNIGVIILSVEEVKELSARLASVTDSLAILYLTGEPTQEQKEAFSALWDVCTDYQAAYENFSK